MDSGAYSIIGGMNNTIKGTTSSSLIVGHNNISTREDAIIAGAYNQTTDHLFVLGNGNNNEERHNAFSVDYDGKIYVNGSTTGVDVKDLLDRIVALEAAVEAL